jgi:hypothetical protein
MLLADPPALPSKFKALARYLPDSIKEIKTIRVCASKDTAALSRHVQAWRAPTNSIATLSIRVG